MSVAKPTTPWRPFFPRSRAGCLPCRQRRKKCDERKPRCHSCLLGARECMWPHQNLPPSSPPSTTAIPHKSSPEVLSGPFVGLVGRLEDSEHSSSALSSPERWLSFDRGRAATLTAYSPLFLEHFVRVTGPILVAGQGCMNPLVTCVVAVAWTEDMLMNAILCLGGTHCFSRFGTDIAMQHATLQHYGLAVSSLRLILEDDSKLDPQATLIALLTMIILCEIESIQRHHKGGIYPHLRAIQTLVIAIRNKRERTMSDIERTLEGFVLELYAYFALVGNITPYGLEQARTILFDPLLISLEELKEYDTFGIMLSSIHDLFALIPKISILSLQKLRDACDGSHGLEEYNEKFRALQVTIQEWQPDLGLAAWTRERIALAEVYRNALLIYLKTSMCSPVVSSQEIRDEIQGHIDSMIPLIDDIEGSSFAAILLWPTMIMGACLMRKDQQLKLKNGLRNSRFGTSNLEQASELLEKLWADQAPYAYGTYGLHYVMRKYGISFCMS